MLNEKLEMRNEVMNLSEHFTLAELTKTSVKIDNVPNEEQVDNATEEKVEQPLWRRR